MRTYYFAVNINGQYEEELTEEEIDERLKDALDEGEDWRSWSIEELAKSLSFRNWRFGDLCDFLEDSDLTVNSCKITEEEEVAQ